MTNTREHTQWPPAPSAGRTRTACEIERWLVENIAALAEVSSDEIEVDAPLTSLGIESLALFSLAGDLATWLEREIPTTLLWEYPTIREIAGHFGEAHQTEKPHYLVPIQPQGDGPALYLVHDVTGTLWCYAALAHHLDQPPLYGFHVPEGEDVSGRTVETLAAAYVAELRAHQPAGPYHLGGYSVGGAIALRWPSSCARKISRSRCWR